jgi:hypothetical protein
VSRKAADERKLKGFVVIEPGNWVLIPKKMM